MPPKDKAAYRARRREIYRDNADIRERRKAEVRDYYKRNAPKVIARAKKRYRAKRAEILADLRSKYAANPQKFLARQAKYAAKKRKEKEGDA